MHAFHFLCSFISLSLQEIEAWGFFSSVSTYKFRVVFFSLTDGFCLPWSQKETWFSRCWHSHLGKEHPYVKSFAWELFCYLRFWTSFITWDRYLCDLFPHKSSEVTMRIWCNGLVNYEWSGCSLWLFYTPVCSVFFPRYGRWWWLLLNGTRKRISLLIRPSAT